MDKIIKSWWFQAAKLYVYVFQIVVHICVFTMLITLLIFTAYTGYCYYQYIQPPSAFIITLTPQVQAGQPLTMCYTHVYRYQDYSFRRDVTFVDAGHKRVDFDEITSASQGNKGPGDDNCLEYQVPKNVTPGIAKFRLVMTYHRTGNIIDALNPFTRIIEKSFEIIP